VKGSIRQPFYRNPASLRLSIRPIRRRLEERFPVTLLQESPAIQVLASGFHSLGLTKRALQRFFLQLESGAAHVRTLLHPRKAESVPTKVIPIHERS